MHLTFCFFRAKSIKKYVFQRFFQKTIEKTRFCLFFLKKWFDFLFFCWKARPGEAAKLWIFWLPGLSTERLWFSPKLYALSLRLMPFWAVLQACSDKMLMFDLLRPSGQGLFYSAKRQKTTKSKKKKTSIFLRLKISPANSLEFPRIRFRDF